MPLDSFGLPTQHQMLKLWISQAFSLLDCCVTAAALHVFVEDADCVNAAAVSQRFTVCIVHNRRKLSACPQNAIFVPENLPKTAIFMLGNTATSVLVNPPKQYHVCA